MYSLVGQLPKHLYVYVDPKYTHKDYKGLGLIPAVWFGLVSYPGRMWGCTVLLENGAVYRNLPPHALSFQRILITDWKPQDAQIWDCYGERFSCIEYRYLSGLTVKVRANGKEYGGTYLFTVAPVGDGFSAAPEQAKEFSFIRLDNGRLTIQPTNNVLFVEKSFTVNPKLEFPMDLGRQTEIYTCEDYDDDQAMD